MTILIPIRLILPVGLICGLTPSMSHSDPLTTHSLLAFVTYDVLIYVWYEKERMCLSTTLACYMIHLGTRHRSIIGKAGLCSSNPTAQNDCWSCKGDACCTLENAWSLLGFPKSNLYASGRTTHEPCSGSGPHGLKHTTVRNLLGELMVARTLSTAYEL